MTQIPIFPETQNHHRPTILFLINYNQVLCGHITILVQVGTPVQATSVASEQSFSIAGQTITSQRNRLDADTARASLCLRSWIRNELCGISI
jgi:hypothetical protein